MREELMSRRRTFTCRRRSGENWSSLFDLGGKYLPAAWGAPCICEFRNTASATERAGYGDHRQVPLRPQNWPALKTNWRKLYRMSSSSFS